MTDTLSVIIDVLKDKFKVTVDLSGNSSINEIGIDSLDVINFLYTLEEHTGVKILDEDIDAQGLTTLSQFAKYIDTHQ